MAWPELRNILWHLADVAKTRIGTIVTFTLGATFGAGFMSKGLTIKNGQFYFSTDLNTSAYEALENEYKQRKKNLLDHANERLERQSDPRTTPHQKQEDLDVTISHFLVPTSQDRLFNKDLVIYNGKGKPTILSRDEFSEIKSRWVKYLNNAQIRPCVQQYIIGDDFSAFHESAVKEAVEKCARAVSSPKTT